MEPTTLGLALSISGGLSLGALYLALKRRAEARPSRPGSERAFPGISLSAEEAPEAVLLVGDGGRVLAVNGTLRRWLGLKERQTPDIEEIAARIRPGEAFLALCAEEGETQLAVNGHLVQARSLKILVENRPVRLVTFKGLREGQDNVAGGDLAARTLSATRQIAGLLGRHTDPTTLLHALLEEVEFLLPADRVLLCIPDENSQNLVACQLTGAPGETDRIRRQTLPRSEHDLAWYVYLQSAPVMAVQPEQIDELHRGGFSMLETEGVRSFIGAPLRAGEQVEGALLFLSNHLDALGADDFAMVELVASQIGAVLGEFRQRQQEGRRSSDLGDLLALAQGFTGQYESRNIFESLLRKIAPLVPLEVLGFLLYDEKKQVLEGKIPFQGLPPQFIEVYFSRIPPNSEAEKLLLLQETILTGHAADSREWDLLGLTHLAQAASLQETVLVPLVSSGRMLGYLQASNHRGGKAVFTDSELNLLSLAAAQAAPIIENAALLQENVRRVQHIASLRRVANLASSAAASADTIRLALRELASSFNAEIALLFLLDESSAALALHPGSSFGRLAVPEHLPGLTMSDAQFPFSVTSSTSPRISVTCSRDDTLIPFYREALIGWGIESVVITPLVVRDQGIGEIWLGSQKPAQFNPVDAQFISSAGVQLASVIENSRLLAQTDEDTQRRLKFLAALRRIEFELSSSADLDYLVQVIYDEAIRASGAERGTVLLFETGAAEGLRTARFHSCCGLERGGVLTRAEMEVLQSGTPVLLQGEALKPVWLPDKRVCSAFLAPIRFHQQSAGLLALYSERDTGFDRPVPEMLQTLATQIGIAIGSGRLQVQLQRQEQQLDLQVKTFVRLLEVTQEAQAAPGLKEGLSVLAQAVTELTPFQAVLASVYDATSQSLVRVCAHGISAQEWQEGEQHTNRWKDVEKLLQPEFQLGVAYFIPAGAGRILTEELHTIAPAAGAAGDAAQSAWQTDDMLLLPLAAQSGSPLGLLSLDLPSDGRRPQPETLELLGFFSRQAALTLQYHQQRAEGAESLSTLETLRNRLRWDLDQARQEVELLRLESSALSRQTDQLNQELAWARIIPALVQAVSRQSSSGSYMAAFSQELMNALGFDSAVIARKSPEGPKLLVCQGEAQKKTGLEVLLGQQNPIRVVFQSGRPVYIEDVQADPDWRGDPLLSALEAQTALALPILPREKEQYAVLVLSKQPVRGLESAGGHIAGLARLAEFGLENLQNVEAANTRLREVNTLLAFNRKLDELDPAPIYNNLLETVLEIIPSAEGAWVGSWDEATGRLAPVAARGYAAVEELLKVSFGENGAGERNAADLPALPLRACLAGCSLRVKEVDFPRDYRLPPDDLVRYRQATAGKLPLSSLLAPLKRQEHILGVLVIDHFSGAEEFSEQDEALATSLAQQAALALENARLFVESEKRSEQLQALTESTAVIASSLQSDELKQLFLEQIRKILPFDTATLWLRDGAGLAIAAVDGFEDPLGLLGLSVSIEDSALFQEMERTRQPVSVANVYLDQRFPSLALHEYLSWLGIPMLAKTELVGIIALEKRESGFYTADQVRAALTFASQAALSLFNARLLAESNQRSIDLDQRSQRLARLNQLSDQLIASLDVAEILRVTLEQLRSALHVTRVAAVLLRDGHLSLELELPTEERLPRRLPEAPLLEHLRHSMGVFLSSSLSTEKELQPLVDTYFTPRRVNSVLMIPLETSVQLLGWVWLQTEEAYRFSSTEVNLARTMANQAAIAIQNATLFAETQRLTGHLEQEVVERTKALQIEHLHNQTLLKMIGQLSVTIQVHDVLEKTLSILNELMKAEQCFILLDGEPGRIFSTGRVLSGRDGSHPTVQRLADWVNANRIPFLTGDVAHDERVAAGETTGFRSAMAAPLMLGGQVLGTLFLLHRKADAFNTGEADFVEAAARQLSIALNNANLFELARKQSDQLAAMLREQQIESSRSFAILEAVADGVLVTDAANHITLFNASAEKILGIGAGSVTGRRLEELAGMLKMENATWFQTIFGWSAAEGHIPEGTDYAQQLDLAGGQVVLVHLAPVILGDAFLGTVSIVRDITQEVMVDRLKSDFVANVSHELRTPLTSIKGYADLMLMGASGALTEEQQKFMQVIRENTRRLNVLVNDLLDISHIDAGQLSLSFQPLDLLGLTRSILAEIENRSVNDHKPIQLTLEAPDSLPLVSADHEKIRQVLMNLVSNGYHYTPSAGQVIVRLHRNGKEVQVDVVDSGIGIGAEEKDRIFERFYRGDHPFVLATAGTGLGLAISKILVEMHGGRIWFESSGVPGEGSVFSFTLPLNMEEQSWQRY